MGKSNSHKLGSFLGVFVEDSWRPILARAAASHGLYLDYKHDRPARPGKKVSWLDEHKNKHDLDFVIERDGSEQQMGVPVAFVEIGYRRYTKHSSTKVRDTWGQINPVADANAPKDAFRAAVLMGDFTRPSLRALRSNGIVVLHYDFQTLVDAFAAVGIDIYFNEKTSESALGRKFKECKSMPASMRERVLKALRRSNEAARRQFLSQMRSSLTKLANPRRAR